MKNARIDTRMTESERKRLLAAAPDRSLSQAVREAIALYIQAKAG